ncbi:abc transporter, partial [Reticulomyxa filosa]
MDKKKKPKQKKKGRTNVPLMHTYTYTCTKYNYNNYNYNTYNNNNNNNNKADSIADRIAILNHGRLRIYGSCLYLKSMCGVGYNLIFTMDQSEQEKEEKEKEKERETLDEVIRRHLPEVQQCRMTTLKQNIGSAMNPRQAIDIMYKTKLHHSGYFPSLFQYIDVHKRELHVLRYAVSVTTLNEVFMKISTDHTWVAQPSRLSDSNLCNPTETEQGTGTEIGTGIGTGTGARIEIEMETQVQSGIDMDVSIHEHSDQKLQRLIDATNVIVLDDDNNNDDENKNGTSLRCKHCASDIWQILKKRYRVTSRDVRALLTTIVMPVLSLLFSLSLLSALSILSKDPTSLALTANVYQTPLFLAYNNFSLLQSDNQSSHLFSDVLDKIALLPDVQLVSVPDIPSLESMNMWIYNITTYSSSTNVNASANRRDSIVPSSSSLYCALYLDPDSDSVVFLYDKKQLHILPIVYTIWDTAVLQSVTNSTDTQLHVSSFPFPMSTKEKWVVAVSMTTMVVLIVSLSFSFIPTSFAYFIVNERISTVKHQHFIAGMSILSYWLANLLFDLAIFLLSSICGGIILYWFEITLFNGLSIWSIILLFGSFGVSIVALTYCLSSCFDKPQTAQLVIGRIFELGGFLVLMIGLIADQLFPKNTTVQWALSIFRFMPNFAFAEALFRVAMAEQMKEHFVHPKTSFAMEFSQFFYSSEM